RSSHNGNSGDVRGVVRCGRSLAPPGTRGERSDSRRGQSRDTAGWWTCCFLLRSVWHNSKRGKHVHFIKTKTRVSRMSHQAYELGDLAWITHGSRETRKSLGA